MNKTPNVLAATSRSTDYTTDNRKVQIDANAYLVKNLGNIPADVNGVTYMGRDAHSFQSGGGFVIYYGMKISIKFRPDLLTEEELQYLEENDLKKQWIQIYEENYYGFKNQSA